MSLPISQYSMKLTRTSDREALSGTSFTKRNRCTTPAARSCRKPRQHLCWRGLGFHVAEGDPSNLKVCQRGEWQDRRLVETVLSMLTLVCHFKKVMHRGWM